jgi:hypothetical protein
MQLAKPALTDRWERQVRAQEFVLGRRVHIAHRPGNGFAVTPEPNQEHPTRLLGAVMSAERLKFSCKRPSEAREDDCQLQFLYGSTVSLSMIFRSGESGRGTCTLWRRTCNLQHAMLANLPSRQWVCRCPQRTLRESRSTGSPYCLRWVRLRMSRPIILQEDSACRNRPLTLQPSSVLTGPTRSTTCASQCPTLTNESAPSSSTDLPPFAPGPTSSGTLRRSTRGRLARAQPGAHRLGPS